MKTLSSLYEVLGVGPTADSETLRKAYRRLARKHHPDVSADPRAHENMARINDAFQVLIDPAKRQEYDAQLAGGTFDEAPGPRTPQKPVVVKLMARFQAHMTPVYAVSFEPDSGSVVSSAFDNEIIWWDEKSSKPQRRTKLESGTISTLRAFAGGRLVAAGSSESTVNFWRLNGVNLDAWRASNDEWVSCVAISSDGRNLAAGSLYKSFTVSDTLSGESRYRKAEHAQSVTAVAWSADGAMLATGSADATVKLWKSTSGEPLQTISQVRATVSALAFSPDNKFLAVGAVDLSIRVFDLETGLLVKMMFGHTKPIESLAFHPNGWLFASGSRDGTVGLWNAAKGIGNARIEVSSRPISCVAFSPDGSRLAAGGQDKLVRLWEVTARDEPA
ncbi:MAG: DnaJ domain-containing protein [Fimbriimonas sp.]